MNEFTKGEWVNGYGDGVTGPTTPTTTGPTVCEALEHRKYWDGDRKGEAPPSRHTVVSCGKETIAIVPTINPEGEANAQLIASAPTLKQQRKNLLTACKGLMKAMKAMKAWISPERRSMHQLKTDMDLAYEIADTAIANCEKEPA